MHSYVVSDLVRDRVIRRQGKMMGHDTIEVARSALVVIDMRNYFVAEGFPLEVPIARDIVPNINRLATAMRDAGGLVVWVQTTAAGALEQWGNFHRYMLRPEVGRARLAGLDEGAEGFRLYPALDPSPADPRVKKVKFSAFIAGSSDIDALLRGRGIESVLITGTLTNVCCESSARDAMMLDYRVIMVSDANATLTDDEHTAALNNVYLFFGDVMTTSDAIQRLTPAAVRAGT
jgi:ureidoacrylate peracid hydrolase